jgi:hypothetical protein
MKRKVVILVLGLAMAVVCGIVGYRLGEAGRALEGRIAANALTAAGLLTCALGLFLQRRKAR